MIHYGTLLEDLQNASYVGIYDHYTYKAGTFDLLIHTYVQIKDISGQGGQGRGGQGGRGGRVMSQASFSQQVQHSIELLPVQDCSRWKVRTHVIIFS